LKGEFWLFGELKGEFWLFGELKGEFWLFGELKGEFWLFGEFWLLGELKGEFWLFGELDGEFWLFGELKGEFWLFGDVGLFCVWSLGDDGDPFVVGWSFEGCEPCAGCELAGACMDGSPPVMGPGPCCAGVAGCEAPLGCVLAVAGVLAGEPAVGAGVAPPLGLGDGAVPAVLPVCGPDGTSLPGTAVDCPVPSVGDTPEHAAAPCIVATAEMTYKILDRMEGPPW
jgi:hypothetical protein